MAMRDKDDIAGLLSVHVASLERTNLLDETVETGCDFLR